MTNAWKILPLIILSACQEIEETPANTSFVTFYPPEHAFEENCKDYSDSEICTFNLSLSIAGGDEQSILLKNRKDHSLATDGEGEFLDISATYEITFHNSVQIDLFHNGELIYNTHLFNEVDKKHVCLPISYLKDYQLLSELETELANTKEEALNYVEHCRKINEGKEVLPSEDSQ